MSGELDNLDRWLESLPIDLDTLAALVEGDLRDDQAEAVREQLLAADPELAHRVELMCQDRVALRTLGDERPPAGLAESVIARLEREALLGLADGEASGSIPISRIQPARVRRGAGFGRWLTSPAGAGLAMAAVLALAIGITLQVLPPTGGTPAEPEGLDPVAIDDGGADARSIAMDNQAAEPKVMGEPAEAPADMTFAASDAAAETSPPPVLLVDDLDRAVTLLAQGRLLVRVQCAEPDKVVAKLGPLTGRSDSPGMAWRLGEEVTEPVAVAMQEKFEPPVVAPKGPLLMADDGTDPVNPAVRRAELLPKPSPLHAVFMAETRMDSAAVASLQAALRLGDGQRVVLEELPEALELPRVLTPESVLWWGRPVDEWVQRRYVPVVIEQLED